MKQKFKTQKKWNNPFSHERTSIQTRIAVILAQRKQIAIKIFKKECTQSLIGQLLLSCKIGLGIWLK